MIDSIFQTHGIQLQYYIFFLVFTTGIPKIAIFAKINSMKKKKILIIAAAFLMALAATSCKKTRYCKCTTIQNEEVVELGEDYYTIEDGSSCSDRSKEIVGWGQVICTEVSESEVTGVESHWWDNLFNNKPK